MGCAIATAATIGGITYEEAESLAGGRTPMQLRFPRETKRLLEKITQSRWRWHRIWRPRRLRDIALPTWPVALFLVNKRFGQWVAAKGRLVHDPEFAFACGVDEYCRGEWFVTRRLEPADPSKLKTRPRAAFVLKNLATELSFGEMSVQ